MHRARENPNAQYDSWHFAIFEHQPLVDELVPLVHLVINEDARVEGNYHGPER